MPPIVSVGPETRSRAERRQAQDRIAKIERILIAQGFTANQEPRAAGTAGKKLSGRRPGKRKRTNSK